MTPNAPAYSFELEVLILEAIQNHHKGPDLEPVTLVELHRRLSEAFFPDDVRAVMDDMLRRNRIRVVFQNGTGGKRWLNGRPTTYLEVAEVRR